MSCYKNLINLIISPNKKWGSIISDKSTPEEVTVSLLYPLAGILAIIIFIIEIEFTQQRSESGLEKAIQYAAIAFVQFFASYYIIATIVSKIFHKRHNIVKSKIYIIYILSLTIIFYAIDAILPQYTQYIAPLSLYIIYIAWCGYKHINYDNEKTNSIFVATISAMVLLFPVIISLILKCCLKFITI